MLILALSILVVQADAQLERGTKSGDMEDIILVGADDWHSSVAATPLAIWTDDEGQKTRPLIVLPREVNAGQRMGWVDQAELERYGPESVLHTMRSANVSALVIHGEGEMVKSLVKLAGKEGIKAYVTVTLEASKDVITIGKEDVAQASDETEALFLARDLFLGEMGLETSKADLSSVDKGTLQELDSDSAQLALGLEGIIVSDRLCPVNPDVREDLYDRVEDLIEEYEVDGIVLYNFGFAGDEYCFCDVCKEEFYSDTGIDLSRVGASSYNLQRWNRWKEEQVLEMANEVRNITTDLGPVNLGVVVQEPFDRTEGYNYAELADLANFMIINPVPAPDLKVASETAKTPVYVRLSDDYVEYTISTQNVEGTTDYIEDLVEKGAAGLAFEYDVVYTPLWSELEPPSPATKWLLDRLEGTTLGIGDVFWDLDYRIETDDYFEMAEMVSQRWDRSSGVVLVGDNYSAGLKAALIGSYLNWPVLFVGEDLHNSTVAALQRLDATQVVVVNSISKGAKEDLQDLNLTLIEADPEFLANEMKSRGDEISSVVLTNSHDLSLLPPKPKLKVEKADIGDLGLDVKVNPSQIPAESAGEIARLEITLKNLGEEDVEEIELIDTIMPGRFVIWWSTNTGSVNLTDSVSGLSPTPGGAFFNGSHLAWSIDRLGPHEYAVLNLEIEILHPLDAGWTQPLDAGISVVYADLEDDSDEDDLIEIFDDGPVVNITYPKKAIPGNVEISWEVAEEPYETYVKYYSPDGRIGRKYVRNCEPEAACNASILLVKSGTWTFQIEIWASQTVIDYATENFTIEINTSTEPINVTAFSHTKIPRLSLLSPQMAGARGGILFDVATDPQNLDPDEVEEDLEEMVKELDISPRYLIVVGGPGALPFPSTELPNQDIFPYEYDVYREYQIPLDDDGYQDVASGRIIGLSVYDASQTVARTLAYDRIEGDWRDKALVISAPADYPIWPRSPIPLRIGDYLIAAGLDTDKLREGEATYQRVSSKMDNGQNIVHFAYHGAESGWKLSLWALIDSVIDETHIKQLTLAPQTTTTNACLTSRLKGSSIPLSDEIDVYLPMELEDSISLAFLKAGAVNYVGSNVFSWIFFSDDHSNNMYQAMVFENKTLGEAMIEASNLYITRTKFVEGLEFEDLDESFPVDWGGITAEDMFNETANEYMIFGDPAFRPTIPRTPKLPYRVEAENVSDPNATEVAVLITPTQEWGADWIYWVATETVDGDLMFNAPPALVGEVVVCEDADDVVVKEKGRVVWHEEILEGSKKRVIWPVIRPTLNETRSFTVEYRIVPTEVQVVNVTLGWNPFSLYLDPKDPSLDEHLKRKPYRSVFTLAGEEWNYTSEDSGWKLFSDLEPGGGYIIDSTDNFSFEVSGKPVDLPYKVELQEGWNLVGVPMNETVPIENVTVNADHKRYAYSNAVKEGIVSAFLWRYEDEKWVYVSRNKLMVPGEAYMVEAIQDCKLEFR